MKVVELGSLTKAADLLGFTQSGVSHTINSLETELGFPLLIRNRSGVKLTVNGEQLLKPIREILNWNEQLMQTVASIHGLETGTIRIGTFTSVSVHWLPGMIKQFQKKHPHIELQLIEGDYQEIESWITEGKVDCGFISIPAHGIFEVIPLKRDRMLAILPLHHPLSRLSCLPLSKIVNEPFIIPSKGSDYDVRRVLDKASIKPTIKFSVGDDSAIIAMVENGLGISILPELVLQGRKHNVCMLELEDRSYRSLGIAIQSMKNASPSARRFVKFVQQWLESWESN